MPTQIRVGGEWQEPSACKVFLSGSWRDVVSVKIYKDSAWRTVANFTAPGDDGGSAGSLTLAATPSGLSSTNSDSSQSVGDFIATPSGGLAPYAYVWSIVTSAAGPTFTIDAPARARTSVTASGLSLASTKTCTIQCVVTDGLGSSATSNAVGASFTRELGGPNP